MKNSSYFISDNTAPVHEEVMKAIAEANVGHEKSYGEDSYTSQARILFQKIFGSDADVLFTSTGTAANIIGLSAVCKGYEGVICSHISHLVEHECGALARFGGITLLPRHSEHGKITTDTVKMAVGCRGSVHSVQPRVLSITQATELGTVYAMDELKELVDCAHELDLLVHLDGARLANAAVFLGASFKEITTDLGIDILSFGGTKNGLLNGEAIVLFSDAAREDAHYLHKQGMHLSAKMRYSAAQFIAYFTNDLWRINANRSNNQALALASELKDIPGIQITEPVQTNSVFARIPQTWMTCLLEKNYFYIWDEYKCIARLMTSYNTSDKEIEEFISDVKSCSATHSIL